MDRRATPFSGRIAARRLQGQIEAESFVDPEPARARGNPFLHAAPAGARDRQVLTGDLLGVIERREGWAFVEAARDGYCGWIEAAALAPAGAEPPDHRLAVRTTWAYGEPGLRRPALFDLHFGTRLRLLDEEGKWARIAVAGQEAWVPRRHLAPVDQRETDPIAVAERFLGTPYVWAGNTGFGIDCSGLAQAALLSCGVACPGDSDQQEQALGRALAEGEPVARGDLIFWKGHVALVAGPEMLIHANGYSMDVAYEPRAACIARIAAAGDPVTSRRRLEA